MALIKGKQVATGAEGIDTANLVDDAVTADKLRDDASVDANRAVTMDHLRDLNVTTAKLAANAVTAAKVDSTVIIASGANASTGDQSLGGFKLTNLGAPTSANDAVTKTYADALMQGLDVKEAVRAATTGNITLSGAQTIDGVSVVAGDRVLVKDQTTGSENGIYVAAAGAWSRATDADTSAEVTPGMFVFVSEGTTNADSGWVLATDAPITLGTTSLSFVQFSGAGQITAGAGLTKTGNTLDVGAGNGIQVNADSVEVIYGLVGELTAIDPDDAAAAGSTNKAARVDHQHAIVTDAPSTTVKSEATAAAEGTATSFLRADAQLQAATGTPVGLGSANAQGSSSELARRDHVHERDVARQENVATQNITGTDTALTDTLDATPISNASVLLFLNGVQQRQGAGFDYTISGSTITWLASSGTAVDMTTSDTLLAYYQSAT